MYTYIYIYIYVYTYIQSLYYYPTEAHSHSVRGLRPRECGTLGLENVPPGPSSGYSRGPPWGEISISLSLYLSSYVSIYLILSYPVSHLSVCPPTCLSVPHLHWPQVSLGVFGETPTLAACGRIYRAPRIFSLPIAPRSSKCADGSSVSRDPCGRNCHAGVCEKALLRISRQLGKSALKTPNLGWFTVSAAGLDGQGSHTRGVFFTGTDSYSMRQAVRGDLERKLQASFVDAAEWTAAWRNGHRSGDRSSTMKIDAASADGHLCAPRIRRTVSPASDLWELPASRGVGGGSCHTVLSPRVALGVSRVVTDKTISRA